MASHRPFIARSLHVHRTYIARTFYVKIRTHYVFTSCKRCVKMRSFPKKVVRHLCQIVTNSAVSFSQKQRQSVTNVTNVTHFRVRIVYFLRKRQVKDSSLD